MSMSKHAGAQDRITAKRLIRDHLNVRQSKHGKVYWLDLRHRDFRGLRSVTLRDPADPRWPDGGRTTGSQDEAHTWVRQAYVEYLSNVVSARERSAPAGRTLPGSSRALTVDEACTLYLETLQQEKGGEKVYLNARAVITRHIVGQFPAMPIAALQRKQVEAWLRNLRVTKRPVAGAPPVEGPASLAMKRFVRYCFRSVWRHTMGTQETPFDRMELSDPAKRKEFRKHILEGRVEQLFRPANSYSPIEVAKILAAAVWYDREQIASRRNTSAIARPNTAASIALMIGTGMRVDELTLLRWKCIEEDVGTIMVLGTKSLNALRTIPLQEQVRPWIAELRRLARPADAPDDWQPDPDAYVVTTDPRAPTRRASTRTLIQRLSEALRWAGLKRPGKATHWARATHATWAEQATDVLSFRQLQRYLGHAAERDDETTAGYIHVIKEMIPAEHRRYIRHLPTPAEVEESLQSLVLADRPGWRERCGKPRVETPPAATAD